ncbi:MAG: DNA (cytosine-5-)-methyltransferase [Ruminococcus sp.]|nr:DNA (cytosine-5-)-methyltransferase [Ruminococcus sp.]
MLNVLSLFSGIGAFEKALQRLGIEYNLLGYCEIDKKTSKAYSLIHNVPESMNAKDVCKIDELDYLENDIDLITYGFPCQDISVAGLRKGFTDKNGERTRSGLFFEALRIIELYKPKYAIAENVKNLTSKRFKKEFEIVLSSLEKVGYKNYWKVLNAKNFGVPQNRERVFIVSIREDITQNFTFPTPFPLKTRLKDLLEENVDEKYFLSQLTIESYLRHADSQKVKGNGFGFNPRERESGGSLLNNYESRIKKYRQFHNRKSKEIKDFTYEVNLMDTDKILRIGHIQNGQDGEVIDERGICPTHTAGHGRCPKVLTAKRGGGGG